MGPCHCHFVPDDVFKRLACDPDLSEEYRRAADDSALMSQLLRDVRLHFKQIADFSLKADTVTLLSNTPEVMVFDCKQAFRLPGVQVKEPDTSTDESACRVHTQTQQLMSFLREVFKRNSIDNAGMTMMSSVHYGKNYNNAIWSGLQMVYGDGDGALFLDFSRGNDVIGHEMAHGMTQYSLQLEYDGEAGGLNESISDCFGIMFSQWRSRQDAVSADWLLGKDILGPRSRQRGYTCMRDMADPTAQHCLAPQPAHYKDLRLGMDPHYTSGPPNLAFCTACKQIGGYSWETIGQVWYHVLTGSGLRPHMGMEQFAHESRHAASSLFGQDSAVVSAVDMGWKKVGL